MRSKRVVKLTAKDDRSDIRVDIRADIAIPNGALTPDEQNRMKAHLADSLSIVIRGLPYTTYNSLNTRVA